MLANNLFPLRLMGPGLTASQKLGRIKSIIAAAAQEEVGRGGAGAGAAGARARRGSLA